MLELLQEQNHVVQALIATLFTWFVTALGACTVFFAKSISRRFLDFMLAFAGGVMIAASFWSLLAPAIAMAEAAGGHAWIPAAVGFMLGGFFIRLVDLVLPHLHLGEDIKDAHGIKTSWHRSTLLVLAITLHNIPEGLAVGVAFGALAVGGTEASFPAAVALAIGIGIQNFPEGMAVAVPLRREGMGRFKSFWYGQLSGAVEPIAGVIGALAIVLIQPLLPYALSFAAGAMIFVVVDEVVPEARRQGHASLATTGVLIGFTVMMVLDVAIGQ
jgi:ZIP family zinc transporter